MIKNKQGVTLEYLLVHDDNLEKLIAGKRLGVFCPEALIVTDLGEVQLQSDKRIAVFTIGASVLCYLQDLPELYKALGYSSKEHLRGLASRLLPHLCPFDLVTVLLFATEQEEGKYVRLADHVDDVAP